MIQLKPGILPSALNKPRKADRHSRSAKKATGGLHFERVFSDRAVKPFDKVEWEHRTAEKYFYNRATVKAERSPTQYEYPQGSACFIQDVDDTMEDIMRLAMSEAMLFKYGSGTGTDLSTLRSTKEKLSGGGKPSGPLSFLKVYDQVANVVKSGGKTRRAAKMNTLKDW